MPEDTLYDRDFYAWTAEQAERVRRLPADCGVDVANVVEELEIDGEVVNSHYGVDGGP